MIVYGDPQFACTAQEAVAALRSVGQAGGGPDHARRLLIRAGQLEQGIADAADAGLIGGDVLASVEKFTERLAEGFCKALTGEAVASDSANLWGSIVLPSVRLTIKVPEGFEFYTLYPEQYAAAAREWHARHASSSRKQVLVIGVRSIGTTLSAVVAATLRERGWTVERCTVRPKGHAYQRQVNGGTRTRAEFAVIVDEGPGISGSSMVAAARVALASGISRKCICFFPGHGGMPGHAASEEIREWWNATEQILVPQSNLRWNGCTLEQILSRATEQWAGVSSVSLKDVGGGQWREAVYESPEEWPPAFIPFERSKFLSLAPNGAALLWKFNGLGACHGLDVERRSASRYSIRPVAETFGFQASPWINGERMTNDASAEEVIPRLAEHIIATKHPPLSPEQHEAAVARLTEMTFWNTKNLLGEEAAHRAITCAPAAKASTGLPTYGDGHLAPWEWIRNREGNIFKTDSSGHDCDHTVIGPQSFLWDIAGAIVEWRLSPEQVRLFLSVIGEHHRISEPALRFYRSAYAAFQAGKASLCRDIVRDEEERKRLAKAVDYYSGFLKE